MSNVHIHTYNNGHATIKDKITYIRFFSHTVFFASNARNVRQYNDKFIQVSHENDVYYYVIIIFDMRKIIQIYKIKYFIVAPHYFAKTRNIYLLYTFMP